MSGSVLALVAAPAGAIDRPSLEALTLAAASAAALGAPLEAIVVADGASSPTVAAGLRSPTVATALVIDHPSLTVDHPDGWAAALAGLIEARQPAAVFGPGTERGNELMARMAARLALPFAANCVA